MQNGFSFKNLLENLSNKKKIGILIFIILVGILSALLIFGVQSITPTGSTENPDNLTTDQNSRPSFDYNSNTKENAEDYTSTLIKNDYTYSENDPNYYFEHTKDPNLISTFLPHIEYRNQNAEDLNQRSAYFYAYLSPNNPNLIIVSVEDCDEAQDKIRAKNYFDSLPIDLSKYTIEYKVETIDTYCGN